MKAVKLILVSILLVTLGIKAFAGENRSQAVIQQLSEDLIKVKAEICNVDEMRVVITNENGDVVFEDKFTNQNGLAVKTYDFSKTRVGGYYVTVYCNDKILETTTIGDGQVAKQDRFYFVLN